MEYYWADKIEPEQLEEFHKFYCKEWWTKDRSFEDVAHMLAHCDLTIYCLDDSDEVIGFARVLTDYTFKAMIFDVIVSESYRGRGLGKLIITQIFEHEALKRVRSFELYCPDRLVGFYEKLGFVKGEAKLLFYQR